MLVSELKQFCKEERDKVSRLTASYHKCLIVHDAATGDITSY